MTPPPNPRSAFRRALLVVGLGVLVATGGWVLDHLFRGGLDAPLDFAEYWTAGRLNLAGENPYSGANVRQVQQGLGLDNTAIMMWNPPWALSTVMPIGAFPFRTAYGVWVLFNLALVAVSVDLLWRGLGGPSRFRWSAHLIGLTFGPTVFLIGSGQITAVVLLGLSGFLYFARCGRPTVAGMFAALTAVKPHLLALFAVWMLLEATRSAAARKVVLGGVLVGLAASVPPTLANPDVWAQFSEASRGPSSADHHHVADWAPPVIGWWLRQCVPGTPFAVQWVPLAVGLLGFALWWRRNDGRCPEWASRLPWIVGCSLLVAPYGAWAFDLVLLLVPLLATVAMLARRPAPATAAVLLVWLVSVNAASLAMMLERAGSRWYVWVTPWVLLGCAVTRRLTEHDPASVARVAR